MNFHSYNDATVFLQKVEGFLLEDEATHHLPLGLLYRLVNEKKRETEPFLACMTDESGNVVLVLIMTPPHHLIIAGQLNAKEAIPFLVDELIQRQVAVPSVIGVSDLSAIFAEVYSQSTGHSHFIEMSQRIYRLDHVISPKKQEGHFRVAEKIDINRLANWIYAFDKEALGGTITEEWAVDRAKRGESEKNLYVWEHEGQLVSMAGATKPTKHGIVVSLVYTPPEKRGMGYASNCVAALSQTLLDQGYTYCSLYTDLTNPTSNKIYQEIGYKPVNDSTVYRFNR
jgi:uncharacterized protein